MITGNQAPFLLMGKTHDSENVTTREQQQLQLGKPAAHPMMSQTAQVWQPVDAGLRILIELFLRSHFFYSQND